MKNTTNYSLLLPDETDFYDIGDANSNMEIIDAQMKSNQEKVDSTTTAINSHISNKANPHAVTKAQVGLSNVPNVATNNQTPTYTVPDTVSALASGEVLSTAFGKIAKAVSSLISHIANKSNPHGVTKTQVGLGNADNTSDANKPVSTAQRAAINAVDERIDAYEEVGQLGIPKNVLVAGEDLDNYITAGIYTFGATYTPLNVPASNSNGWLVVLPWSSGGTCKQLWLRHGTLGTNDFYIYTRTRISGVWGEWYEIISDRSQSVYRLTVPQGQLSANSNLNSYRAPGEWVATGTGIAQTILNAPTTLNFKLICEYINNDSYLLQTVISRIGKKWTRMCDKTTLEWTEWIVSYCNNAKEMSINDEGELTITTAGGVVAKFTPSSITG